MDFLFGAVFLDHDFVQDRGHQGGVDTVLEGELPLQGGADFPQLRIRAPPLFRLRPEGFQPLLQGFRLLVETPLWR